MISFRSIVLIFCLTVGAVTHSFADYDPLLAPPIPLAEVSSLALLDENGEAHHHDHGRFHLTHPIITESPLPENKVRINYLFTHDNGGEEHEIEFVGEIAFTEWFGVEFGIPYVFVDGKNGDADSDTFGNAEVAFKFACFCLEDQGIVLGGGVAFGLPTGDDRKGIGSNNEFEIEPFVSAGVVRGPVEIVAVLGLGIPTNEDEDEEDEVDLEFLFNFSFLYHCSDQIAFLVELNGETIASGDEDETVITIAPGVVFRPDPHGPLNIGCAVRIPVSDDSEYDWLVIFSMIYHIE